MSKPFAKQVWKDIVQKKISNQAQLLKRFEIDDSNLSSLVDKVQSGDPENIEAQAARIYWPSLFGLDFRRNRALEGINSMLNFGYAVLRSCMSRKVIASGLNPSFGVFHRNSANTFALCDDLMEPYRPFVDEAVKIICLNDYSDLNPQTKKFLVRSLHNKIETSTETLKLETGISKTARSFSNAIETGSSNGLFYPIFPADGAYESTFIEVQENVAASGF